MPIWSGLGKLLSFSLKHWRVILCLLILWYCYSKYNAAIKRGDDAISALNQHISATNTARAQRDRENQLKESTAQIVLAGVIADHQVTLAKQNLDRQREAKNLKDLYENKILAVNRNWSDRLQLESQREATNATDGLRGLQPAASEFAESGGDCDPAHYRILEQACQITTMDYNALWTAWDKQCQVYGCK